MEEQKSNQIAILFFAGLVLLLAVYFIGFAGGDDSTTTPGAGDLGTLSSETAAPGAEESSGVAALDLSGSWIMTVDVIKTDGVCVGEENDPPYEKALTIVHEGNQVEVSGIDGPAEPWNGASAPRFSARGEAGH